MFTKDLRAPESGVVFAETSANGLSATNELSAEDTTLSGSFV